jgi:acyl-CoA dehydrogenase
MRSGEFIRRLCVGAAWLAQERLIRASLCAEMAEAALLEAIKYTKDREALGKPLIKFQHNRFELAELKPEVLSIKTTVDYRVQQYIDGNNDPATASMGKLTAADKGCDKIYGGPSEIMKEIIGRSL